MSRSCSEWSATLAALDVIEVAGLRPHEKAMAQILVTVRTYLNDVPGPVKPLSEWSTAEIIDSAVTGSAPLAAS